jgi:hypothetical protein
METIYDPTMPECGVWECFRHEMRTALSLEKKGLVSFPDDERPDKEQEYFMAQLTDSGKKMMGA